MEAAFAIAAVVLVLAMCVAGLSAVGAQVRCVDAAREAARLAARGDQSTATEVAGRIAPDGAAVDLRWDGRLVVARVSSRPPMLFGITIAARAVAAAEPGVR
ncbi:TadE family type IV pilus minor pilin [Mycolicibacterium baixiangningiae]|uniref:TadE family type IV pilus minor pilin n=1 Tax=Mycolicibacterium baixiangningiae TaxID=2761578 RepID=UPI001E2AEC33|nr:TadE family type IV pilus minor pilin [Mycolicibacterium baixiangningiae]